MDGSSSRAGNWGAASDRVNAGEALALLEAALDTTADGILVADREGRIVSVNRRFLEIFRVPAEVAESRDYQRILGLVLDQLLEPDQFLEPGSSSSEGQGGRVEILPLKDGRVLERSGAPRGDARVAGRVWSFRDVTEQYRLVQQLHHLADHDATTGLINRRRFEEELAREVAKCARLGAQGALLVLDLDSFQDVNDTHGHAGGDEVLRAVARLLSERIEDLTDLVARVGGDEFAILLSAVDAATAAATAEELREAIAAQPLPHGDGRVRVTASFGVAPFIGGETPAEDLLVKADLAIYDAKDRGRDRVVVVEPGSRRREQAMARVHWSGRLREALEDGRFVLYAQPIIDLNTDAFAQHELLLRLLDDEGELIEPRDFLAVAERTGLIEDIDRWAVRQAVHLIERARDAGRELTLSVNLSGHSLSDGSFPPVVARSLARSGVDPSQLILEVTESAAIANMERAVDFARKLRGLGCRCAIDDFGSGFGSFHYLKYLPVDYVKISGDFVTNLPRSATDQLVVNAIADVARALDTLTVAKAVEDGGALGMLRSIGVDLAQGMHIAPPGPADEILGLPTS